MIITIHKNTFKLSAYKGAYWIDQDMLLIADVHLGKLSHFRKHGSAVPNNAIINNFDQLEKIKSEFNPKTICFLGDLFHSYINSEWQLFEEWVKNSNCKIVLIAGNHDVISPVRYSNIGIEVLEEMQIDNFLLTHYPILEKLDTYFNFCGHLHPGIKLKGKGLQRLKLPCFYKSDWQCILPAFGEFTGMHTIKPQKNEEAYVIADNEVVKIH